MAIQTVRANIGGTWYDLAYNAQTRAWEAAITGPLSSIHQEGGYYNVTVEATNETGATATTDGSNIPGLRLVVRETTPPALTLVSPAEGYVTTKTPQVILEAADGAEGSGVDITTLTALLDGTEAPDGLSWAVSETGYRITFTPPAALSEGAHTVTVKVADYDGNTAEVTLSYTVDTIPPGLQLFSPGGAVIVDTQTIRLAGRAWDVTPVTVRVGNNGVDLGELPLGPDGSFSVDVPMTVGVDLLTVTATDAAGLVTEEAIFTMRLITDRTAADVKALRALMLRHMDAWTAEELAWFNACILKGGYCFTDVNRVSQAALYLAETLREQGYAISVDARTDWQEREHLDPSAATVYLGNVEAIRAVMAGVMEAPETPPDLEGLTTGEANDIEKILVTVSTVFPLVEKSVWQSGELFSGEY